MTGKQLIDLRNRNRRHNRPHTITYLDSPHILPKTTMKTPLLLLLTLATALIAAQPPAIINHQGRIVAGGVNFDGTGHFKLRERPGQSRSLVRDRR